jgi:hypothetical protein
MQNFHEDSKRSEIGQFDNKGDYHLLPSMLGFKPFEAR